MLVWSGLRITPAPRFCSSGHHEQYLQIGNKAVIPASCHGSILVAQMLGSLLRRTRRLLEEGPVAGDEALSIEEHCLKITILGRQLTVSQSEWKLLQLLSKRHGQLVSVEELAGLIWSESEFLRHLDLNALIATLNTKLCSACAGSIDVVPTIGYRLLPPGNPA